MSLQRNKKITSKKIKANYKFKFFLTFFIDDSLIGIIKLFCRV